MASNILSRLILPSGDEDSQEPRNINNPEAGNDDVHFEDQDLEQLIAQGMEHMDAMSSPEDAEIPKRSMMRPVSRNPPSDLDEDDSTNPEPWLWGAGRSKPSTNRKKRRKSARKSRDEATIPLIGPDTPETRAQWQTTQNHQQLHNDMHLPPPVQVNRELPRSHFVTSPKERAMWAWTNVDNLDSYLDWVYRYYEEHGIWSHVLDKVLRYTVAIFVVTLLTFLSNCIDYSKLAGSTKLEQVRIPHCGQKMSFVWNLFIWASVIVMFVRFITELSTLPKWWEMHNFYHYLLEIPDKDIQSVTWQYVVSKVMELRELNPTTAQNISAKNRRFLATQSKQRMDAADIANRLMRRDNYWIAMINKDILDFSVNVPFLGKREFYPYVLQWLVSVCLMDCVFDDRWQVKPGFRSSRNRKENIDLVKRRFKAAGLLAMIVVFPLAVWSVIYRFLDNFTEYQKNPGLINTRRFSSLAEWKIRNFNEVAHLFERRKRLCYPFANRYLDQFPKDKMNKVMRSVGFISGGIAAVLGLLALWDQSFFLSFDIYGRTVLFWVTLFGGLRLITGNAAQEEEEEVLDPEMAMRHVIEFTNYCPDSWKDRLYSDEVRAEFSAMYKLDLLLFLEDLVGTVLTPVLLMNNLAERADRVVDFFREFTIHVDGLGTICSYAEFDFQHARPTGTPGMNDLRENYYGDKANKIMHSVNSFWQTYAPNPRRHGTSNRRTFQPPLLYPGLSNGSVIAEYASGAQPATNPRNNNHAASMRLSALHTHNTPRFGPTRGVGHGTSPVHSILLDPQHQPRQQHFTNHHQVPAPQHHLVKSSIARGKQPAPQTQLTDEEHLLAAMVAEGDEPTGTNTGLDTRTTTMESNILERDSEYNDEFVVRADQGIVQQEEGTKRIRGGVLNMIREMQYAKDRGGHI